MDVYLGAILLFAGDFAPRGFALCRGQLMSISQNAALFSILGTNFGGDGVQTFGLPDLQGRTPVGTGSGAGLSPVNIGEKSGSSSTSILLSNLPPHTHPVNCDNNGQDSATPANCLLGSNGVGGTLFYSSAAANAVMAPTMIGSAGGGVPISTQNPYTGLSFIIATQGIFPSRN